MINIVPKRHLFTALKTGIFGGTFGGLLRIKLLVGPPNCQSFVSSRCSGLKSGGGALSTKQIRLAAAQRKIKHISRDFPHQLKLHFLFSCLRDLKLDKNNCSLALMILLPSLYQEGRPTTNRGHRVESSKPYRCSLLFLMLSLYFFIFSILEMGYLLFLGSLLVS